MKTLKTDQDRRNKIETKKEKGETLITVVVSLSILMGVLFASQSAVFSMKNKASSSILTTSKICRDTARNIINKIQSNGVQAKIFRGPIDRASVKLNDQGWHRGDLSFNPEGVQSEFGSLFAARWPSKKIMTWSNSQKHFKMQTPLLIQSSINSLLSIHNSLGNKACLTAKGVSLNRENGLEELEPMQLDNKHIITASLKIRSFDLNSGVFKACSPKLLMRPYAMTEPPPSSGQGITDFGSFKVDRGLEVEVFVSAKSNDPNKEDQVFDCSVKERFQYDRQKSRPKNPIISFTGQRLEVSLPRSRFEPGTQVACRASSSIHDNHLNRAHRSIALAGTATPIGSMGWEPCDQLKLCGRLGTVSVNRGAAKITVEYNLPPNCMAQVEAVAFDVVGNLSSSVSYSVFDPVCVGPGCVAPPTPCVGPGCPEPPPVCEGRGCPPPVCVGRGCVPPPPRPDPCTGPCTITDPDPIVGTNGEVDDDGGYRVGDLIFRSAVSADRAAAISGLDIIEINNPRGAVDSRMDFASNGLGQAVQGASAAGVSLASAGAAAAGAGAALASATGNGSAAAAGTAAASAGASAANAQTAANSARASANLAAAGLQNAMRNAASLGVVGEALVLQAQAAVDAAEEDALEAERLAIEARLAAEAALRAAAEKARREQEARDRAARRASRRAGRAGW